MPSSFEFSGGALCLDFANTWGNRRDPAVDQLRSYDDLLEWAHAGGVLQEPDVQALREQAARRPDVAAATLHRAVALREALYRIFSRVATGDDPADDDVGYLNRFLAVAMRQLRLQRGGSCCRWQWSAPPGALDRVLWPVVHGAADLLTSDAVGRVRECASPSCAWLFVDSSRNRSRRWCDMATCGNRAKARRYYHRHRPKP